MTCRGASCLHPRVSVSLHGHNFPPTNGNTPVFLPCILCILKHIFHKSWPFSSAEIQTAAWNVSGRAAGVIVEPNKWHM